MDGEPQWPLSTDRQALLGELTTLLAGGGASRFLRALVVPADPRSYPDRWDESRAGVGRVIGRTLWHAYLPIEAQVDDLRSAGSQDHLLLRETKLALTQVNDTSARFEVRSIGNDDVAGVAAHEVGRAFVGWLARHGGPYRTSGATDLPSPRLGSIATLCLGLGVVAANAAHYDRSAGEVRGGKAYHEHAIFRIGGLSVDDLAFLLAVQAAVRDDMLPALTTLRPTQAELVAAWRAVLHDHGVELRQLLGISDVGELEPLTRPDEPAAIATHGELDERDLEKRNLGETVLRYREKRRFGYAALGLIGGLVAAASRKGSRGAGSCGRALRRPQPRCCRPRHALMRDRRCPVPTRLGRSASLCIRAVAGPGLRRRTEVPR